MSEETNAATDATEAAAPSTTTEGSDETLLTSTAQADPEAKAEGQAEGDKPAADNQTDDKAGQGDTNTEQADAEEWTITAPEGMEQFQGDLDAFRGDMDAWLKDNPDATARDALAEAANRQARAASESASAAQEAHNQQVEGWLNEAKADKEIGGADFDANVATAIKALDAFGGDGLRTVLNDSGLGNHPEVIRLFCKVGKATEEAGVMKGSAEMADQVPFANRIYKD